MGFAGGIEGFEELSDPVFDFQVLGWLDGSHFLDLRLVF
jgi:hypothetical protein